MVYLSYLFRCCVCLFYMSFEHLFVLHVAIIAPDIILCADRTAVPETGHIQNLTTPAVTCRLH